MMRAAQSWWRKRAAEAHEESDPVMAGLGHAIRRLLQERALAAQATDPRARAAHLAMAEDYARRIGAARRSVEG